MPINYRQNIRINPVDLPENERTAVGITFPFNNKKINFWTKCRSISIKNKNRGRHRSIHSGDRINRRRNKKRS